MDKILGKYKNIIIIAGIVGIALIFLSGFFKSDEKETMQANTTSTTSSTTSDEYATKIENSLTNLISNIDGVGNANVLVTLETGTQTQYATEEKVDNETQEDKKTGKTETTYITIKNKDGSEEAIPITEYAPTIRGVVVVCDGGDQPVVQKRVTDTVTTALNIPSSHVCVTK